MKTIYFEQITDSRFSKNDILEELKQREKDIKEKLKDIAKIETWNIYKIDRWDSIQYRQKYYIYKNTWITYNKIYEIVNSINAVPYKLIQEIPQF